MKLPLQLASDSDASCASRTTMAFLEGTHEISDALLERQRITPYRVPKFYREHIAASGYYDRLKRIVEPSLREFASPGRLDTSGEADNTVVPGLQHKYPQTGLLLVTEQCAAFCRYCFRKRFVGASDEEVAPDYTRVAEYIQRHPEMNNVLLSGGDPLMLSTRRLNRILDHLLPIPHLTSIRFGSKTPAFNPRRLADESLLDLFERIRSAGKRPVIVAHFDHFAEFSSEAQTRVRQYQSAGVQFLNQMVLLAGVNDDADTLAATFEKCHALGVRPYYLFQTRPVLGASHFQVPLRRGVAIVQNVNRKLSGIQKTFRYIMSHETGKIEILDVDDRDRIYLRYHQCKDADRIGRVFSRYCPPDACWFDDLPPSAGRTTPSRQGGLAVAS
jgi:KamA family protein